MQVNGKVKLKSSQDTNHFLKLKMVYLILIFQVRLWDLPRRECLRTLTAHTGFVRGLCVNPSGNTFLTVSLTL